MTFPNFLIVGAQKAGTTTLYDILKRHPEVNMSLVKEINFFTSEKKISKGLEYYSSFFRPPNINQKVTGEASPGYMNFEGVPKMIKDKLGDIKIVMILRDPIDRAMSQYWDNRRHLSEFLNESEIVQKYLTEIYSTSSRGYFSRGVYIKYIKEYLKYFKREYIHIIILEELIREPESILLELYKFLGISSSKETLKLNKASNSSIIWDNKLYLYFLNNPSKNIMLPKHLRRFLFFGAKTNYKYPHPSSEIIKILQDFYEPWNKELESFLGRKMTFWKTSKANY